MSKLGTQIKALATESLESYLTANFVITQEHARNIIHDLTFMEHMEITNYLAENDNAAISKMICCEDNTQLANNTVTPPSGDTISPGTTNSPGKDSPGLGPDPLDVELQAMQQELNLKDPNALERNPAGDITLNGQLLPDEIANHFAPKRPGVIDSAKQGYQKGLNSSEDQDEIHRIQELAGITTSPNNKSGMPSVAGNTAHKPTDRLRSRRRVKVERGPNATT